MGFSGFVLSYIQSQKSHLFLLNFPHKFNKGGVFMNKSKKIILTLCLASKLVWGYSSTVYQVQQQLNELGYRISVDGKMGQKTAKAIQQGSPALALGSSLQEKMQYKLR